MLRTALQPRWLTLLAAVLVVCAGFGWLGSWQLNVARDRGAAAALRELRNASVVPLDEVLAPQRSFTAAADGRRVSARGTYDPSQQVLVAGRLRPGSEGSKDRTIGWWVVSALRTSTGAWLPVVRGWVAHPDDPAAAPAAAPSGPAIVQGVLQPDEPPASSPPVDGRLDTLDVADLVNRWGTPIYNGFLVLTSQHVDVPAGAPTPTPVPPPAPQPHGIAWRNAAYAVQWWVFAGFALVMWGKMVQQAARDEADGREEEAAREHTRT